MNYQTAFPALPRSLGLRAYGEAADGLITTFGDLPDSMITWDGPVTGSDGSAVTGR